MPTSRDVGAALNPRLTSGAVCSRGRRVTSVSAGQIPAPFIRLAMTLEAEHVTGCWGPRGRQNAGRKLRFIMSIHADLEGGGGILPGISGGDTWCGSRHIPGSTGEAPNKHGMGRWVNVSLILVQHRRRCWCPGVSVCWPSALYQKTPVSGLFLPLQTHRALT